ncbi:MAG: DUF1616 domain-containing protein [Candidatus Aenigmarchaeota archaeon]|nr:DUF1616 domain-containing protein [Candidatus Aenigmarchaeota archaeon]
MKLQALKLNTERDLILVNFLSTLLIAVITFFPDSPARIILGLPFILFFPGYMLICALFPVEKDLDWIERLVLSMGLSIAVTSLIGLALNYTPFGIRLYSVTFSLFLFMLLMSAVAMYRRRIVSPEDAFAPLSQISISGRFERVEGEFLKSSEGNKVIKLIAIIAFTFIISALTIIARTLPASGYEISIYDAYPPYFWFFIIASIACGICILVHQAFAEQKSNWWSMGLFIIIFTNLIIILLPVFRGYFISSGGDEISHLGMIKDIALTGRAGRENVYPISHILSISLSYILGLDSRSIIKIVPAIFYLIYMGGLYILAKIIGKKYEQVLLVMAFGSVLLFTYFNILFLPTQFFLYLIPLILMLLLGKIVSSNRFEYTIVFIIMLLPMPFLHPLGSVFLILIFLLFEVSILIHHFLLRGGYVQSATISYPSKTAIVPALIVFITFFMWFSVFALFRTTIARASEWFVYGHGTPPVETMTEQFRIAGFTILDFIDLLLNNYGHGLIYILLSFIAIFIILRKLRLRNSLSIEEIFFSLFFLLFSVFYIQTLLGAFICTGRSLRIYCWPLMASTVLNGIVFQEWISKLRGKSFKIYISLLTIFIILAAIIGVFNVYSSPHIKVGNLQVTEMEFNGMEWFFEHKNSDRTFQFDQLPFRAPQAIFGRDTPKPKTVGRFYQVPPHLGYEDNKTLVYSLKYDAYIVISEHVKVVKTKLWPDVGRYTLSDLNKLSSDTAASKIYFNGELEILKVSTKKNKA